MSQARLVLASAALCAGLAASVAFADAMALEKFPGAEKSIMSYYAENAREGAGNCGAGHMGNIDEARVVSESADQAVLAVNYVFSAMSQAGTEACSGPGSREFTLTKGASGWGVSSMTGQGP